VQRNARLQPFKLDSGAGPGAQKTVGSFPQLGSALGRIVVEGRIEGSKKDCDIFINAFAKRPIDKSPALANFIGVVRHPGGAERWPYGARRRPK
jgi:hypothetical protein